MDGNPYPIGGPVDRELAVKFLQRLSKDLLIEQVLEKANKVAQLENNLRDCSAALTEERRAAHTAQLVEARMAGGPVDVRRLINISVACGPHGAPYFAGIDNKGDAWAWDSARRVWDKLAALPT